VPSQISSLPARVSSAVAVQPQGRKALRFANRSLGYLQVNDFVIRRSSEEICGPPREDNAATVPRVLLGRTRSRSTLKPARRTFRTHSMTAAWNCMLDLGVRRGDRGGLSAALAITSCLRVRVGGAEVLSNTARLIPGRSHYDLVDRPAAPAFWPPARSSDKRGILDYSLGVRPVSSEVRLPPPSC